MKPRRKSLLELAAALLVSGSLLLLAQTSAKSFVIYDNMLYKGKPDTASLGLIPSNVILQGKIWPDRQSVGTLPDRAAFEALVHASSSNPGPLVIDIETMSLRMTLETARHTAETLATLADWAHAAAPGKVIGYYGTNTLSDIPPANLSAAQELAKHVDAFFPALYTFDDNRERWEKRAQISLAQSRELDAKKPVYFYLWPQYHVGSARAMRYVPGDFWKFELETARKYGDGVVIWSSGTYVWDPRSGWWEATKEFAAALQTGDRTASTRP